MSKNCKIDFKEIQQLENGLRSFKDEEVQIFIDSCAKELAARLIAKTVKRTPVGVYPKTGKVGGTLRRGWTGGKTRNATQYVNGLAIKRTPTTTVIEVTNPVEYAEYVEFGHRTSGGKGWVEGKFMLTVSTKEIQSSAPSIIEAKLKKELGGVFR